MSSSLAATRVGEFCASVSRTIDAAQLRIGDSRSPIVDGVMPEATVALASLDQLQEVLSEARRIGVSVIASGGGAHLGLGNVPDSYDVALSLLGMARIIDHEPADLTVTVEPGVRLVDLQRRLREHGQFLPLDPPSDDRATIGGVLGANAYGPLRHAYGTARDWLIGTRVVHADGSVSKSGGRVVKNVAGYDMHKLYVGSLGTLGVIAESTFKLAPLPQVESTVVISCRSAAHAADLVLGAHDAGLALHAAELLSPPAAHAVAEHSGWCVVARVAGGAAAVERSLREIDTSCAATGARAETRDTPALWGAWSSTFRPRGVAMRVHVMPSVVGEAMSVLDRRFAGAGAMLSATVSLGVLRIVLGGDSELRAASLVQVARDVAGRFDGSLLIEAAPVSVKREIDVFGPLRSDFPTMKRLKDEFDPTRVLSPGRFIGRL